VALGFGDREGTDGLGDVLEGLFAEREERERELVTDLVVHAAGHADPAGLGRRLQARGDVDPVPQEVLPLHHDVPEVDADAEAHLTGLR